MAGLRPAAKGGASRGAQHAAMRLRAAVWCGRCSPQNFALPCPPHPTYIFFFPNAYKRINCTEAEKKSTNILSQVHYIKITLLLDFDPIST